MKLPTLRTVINVLIFVAAFAAFKLACGQVPRYVLRCSPRVVAARIDSAKRFVGKTEATGNNDGAWVAELLRHVGINFPAPYCAAGTVTGFDLARGAEPLPIKRSPLAVVIGTDAMKRGTLAGYNVVRVGDCVVYQHPGTTTGHIVAAVTRVAWPYYFDIEFNTSSGNAGNQRDGGGCYRRVRKFGNLGSLHLKTVIGFRG